MAALPYKQSKQSKRGQVEEMFDNISPRYDFLNHVLSFNIDKIWRKKTIKKLKPYQPEKVLDIATGTGDFAIAALKLGDVKVTGIDISEGMLNVGRQKVAAKKLDNQIQFKKADSEELPFEADSFDAAIVGFGVRNFEHLEKGLAEILRVIKPGGAFFVLEFSKPEKFPFKQIYMFYFTRILPFVGRMISKDSRAYTYLPESVNEFPDGERFLTILADVGFVRNECYRQTFGIATIYKAHKPNN
ncbi:bifunctional demethylmenaquinone methyltransferase/2-methoxy-6-polyprenyl-1,4-benzoquinol methylase UbiE [Draconibacterium sp. IB214405]|uniref:bifunctional demethylmenaquinone methyltransferase/2-methoxy-6-polyprenyl-1,4-benzoquinol methylase UbiE n=1 Tax=Draconibacterium sp. IB214405 TaxID=3097352 RepID=UPI002A181C2F|nr:bifunctional demethylmenaquinone methyltransferase/2-methoxy-6-polyprenyl-1,4-benzoquinol methylase UbiE [Draconibacterium sp. IB214405]MDX8338705.1 bifunctional demethylmenaquinone methyltransferase/2-methoxy-6-polyprenyl-1,4-benzoquinol methylase UbiE [Draconibacterium sp. IB214405]